MNAQSTCRACGAAMVWGKTTKGKAIPLDAAPSKRGNVRLLADGTAEVLGAATAQGCRIAGEVMYLSHFVTCSAAASFRKAKR